MRRAMLWLNDVGITSWICPLFGHCVSNNSEKWEDGGRVHSTYFYCFWGCGYCGVSTEVYDQ